MLSGYFCWPPTTYLGNVYFIFSYVFSYGGTKQVSQMNMSHFSHEGHPQNKKNVCEKAKAIVKVEAVFFIIFKPRYKDLI